MEVVGVKRSLFKQSWAKLGHRIGEESYQAVKSSAQRTWRRSGKQRRAGPYYFESACTVVKLLSKSPSNLAALERQWLLWRYAMTPKILSNISWILSDLKVARADDVIRIVGARNTA